MSEKTFSPNKRRPIKLTERGKTVAVIAVASAIITGGVMNLPERDKQHLPTVKEYRANPDAYPEYQEQILKLGDTPWGLAQEIIPGKDPRSAVDAINAQALQNDRDGIGEPGFQAGDPIVLPRTEEIIVTQAE